MSTLKWHLRKVCIGETDEVETFTCQFCDSTFSQNNDFKRHTLNITNNKDGSAKFPCAMCNLEFCNRKFMIVHIKEVHRRNINKFSKTVQIPSEEVKEEGVTMNYYECEFCGKRFDCIVHCS